MLANGWALCPTGILPIRYPAVRQLQRRRRRRAGQRIRRRCPRLQRASIQLYNDIVNAFYNWIGTVPGYGQGGESNTTAINFITGLLTDTGDFTSDQLAAAQSRASERAQLEPNRRCQRRQYGVPRCRPRPHGMRRRFSQSISSVAAHSERSVRESRGTKRPHLIPVGITSNSERLEFSDRLRC